MAYSQQIYPHGQNNNLEANTETRSEISLKIRIQNKSNLQIVHLFYD